MPRVHTQKRGTRGRPKRCGRAGCGREIPAGEQYYSFSFRYGGTQVRCKYHYPKQSELTQSKMSEVYSAIEGAEDDMASAETVQDIIDAVEGVAQTARDIASEYEEAAEAFGGQGENQDRAEMLGSYADELEGFSPEEADEEVDCDECEGTGEVEVDCPTCDGAGIVYPDDDEENPSEECPKCEGAMVVTQKCENCEGSGTLDNSDGLSDAIEAARSDATDLLNEMPF